MRQNFNILYPLSHKPLNLATYVVLTAFSLSGESIYHDTFYLPNISSFGSVILLHLLNGQLPQPDQEEMYHTPMGIRMNISIGGEESYMLCNEN